MEVTRRAGASQRREGSNGANSSSHCPKRSNDSHHHRANMDNNNDDDDDMKKSDLLPLFDVKRWLSTRTNGTAATTNGTAATTNGTTSSHHHYHHPNTQSFPSIRVLGYILVSLIALYHITYSLPAYNSSAVAYCHVAEASKQHLLDVRAHSTAAPTELPKIIHHQWKNTIIPQKYQVMYQAWFDLFPAPEYEHMHWTDEAGRALIETHYHWFLPTYDAYDYHIKRVDAVRYFALHHHGGIHGDLDYEPLVNFYEYLPQDRVAVVESPYQYYERTQNSLMSSPKGDAFWPRVFDQLALNKDMAVMEATGPKLLDTVMLSDTGTTQHQHEAVHVLPCENFQRIPIGETLAPFVARIHKEVLGRFYPMKQCGDFLDPTCQFARHHCSASYLEETGLWDLLFKK